MNILVTGGAGFIGSNLCKYLVKQGCRVAIYDNLSYGKKENLYGLAGACSTFFKDVRDRKDLDYTISHGKFDAIVHLAGIAPLPDCQSDPANCFDNNVQGTINVLEAARRAGVKKFIFASTSALYNQDYSQAEVFPERITPELIYPLSKHVCEEICNSYRKLYGMNITCVRFFNTYGPSQDHLRKQPPLIGYITKCLLENTQPVFHGDGKQLRDYIYVDDVCNLLFQILRKNNKDYPCSVVNACSGYLYSVNQIYNTFCEIAEKYIKPKYSEEQHFWDKYPELFEGKYPLKKKYIVEEVNKDFSMVNSYANSFNFYDWMPRTPLDVGVLNIWESVK